MKQPVVVIGMGEMGDLFARGFLKLGHPVYPILRDTAVSEVAAVLTKPELVLVAVGENELHNVLESLPDNWRTRVALLQNELLPRDWEHHGLTDPTVIVVWFDKKKGRPFVALLPSPVCGPLADLMVAALHAIDVPCHRVAPEERLFELVRKNLYILTINLAGIRTGGTVGELWNHHAKLVMDVAKEILDIQAHLCDCELPRQRLLEGLIEDFAADPQHICMGRTARERLNRALRQARQAGIETPTLDRIATENECGNAGK
jgi:hypothetical protein